jgi:hypothetical protein
VASRRTWLSITVELISGRGETLWPRPGRMFVAAKHHTFERFAQAIDDAFARWDRAHLHQFELYPDGADFRTRPQVIGRPDPDWDDEAVLDIRRTKLSHLRLGQQFVYVFDLGDDWTHLCTVGDQLVDPFDVVGIWPSDMPGPLPYFGWGDIPDQYGRRFLGDTADHEPVPPNPRSRDLPPWRPWWGPDHHYPD